MKYHLLLLIVILIFQIYNYYSFAIENNNQKISELKEKISQLEKQAEEYRKNIRKKHQEAESLAKELEILNYQIAKLKLEISITINKIEKTKAEIEILNDEIFKISENVQKNKLKISHILRNLSDLENRGLIFIVLGNQKFSEFFSQAQYLNSIENRLLINLKELQRLKGELENKKLLLEAKKQELDDLNLNQKDQKTILENTKSAKDDLLIKTRGRETKYRELLNEVEKKKAEFYKELQLLESEARKREVYIVSVKAKSIPSKGRKIFKMPYDDFVITQVYGMTDFAIRGAYGGAPHNGIDLTSGIGSPIKSIGPGVVLAHGFNNAAGYWVAIKHDNDLVSVYAHLREPSNVLPGNKVDDNTIIGYEGSTGYSTGSHLHLSLYSEFFTFINSKTGQVYFNYFKGTLDPLDYIFY